MGTTQVESVYCDFTKLFTDSGRLHQFESIENAILLYFPVSTEDKSTTRFMQQVFRRGSDTMT